MRMNMHLLNCFIAVVENGGVSKAAQALFISQPAVSRMLRQIEEEYDCPMFERDGKRLVLNGNGEILYQHAKKVVEEMNHLEASMQALSHAGEKNLRFDIIADMEHLPKIFIPYFVKDNNNAHAFFKIGNTQEYEKLLLNEKYDVVLTYEKLQTEEITSFFMFKDHIYISCPKKLFDPLPSSFSIEQIKELPFVKVDSRKYANSWREEFINRNKLKLKYFFEADIDSIHLLKYASDFCYFTYYSYMLTTPHPANRIPIPIDNPAATRGVYLTHLKKNEKKVAKLLKSIKRHYKEMFFSVAK